VSALWVLPSLTLAVGALVLWWVGRQAAAEAAALRRDLTEWGDARADMARLRVEAEAVGAGYRQIRRR